MPLRKRSRMGLLAAAMLALPLVPIDMSAAGANAPDESLQGPVEVALDYVREGAPDLGVAREDVADLAVASAYRSSHNGVTHVNLSQRFEGREVFGAYATVNVAAGESVLFVGDSLVEGLRVASATPELDARGAVEAAAEELALDDPEALRVLTSAAGSSRETVVSRGGISDEPIPARLGWQPTEEGLRLAWQLVIDDSSGPHLWNATVDAGSGELLAVDDWTDRHSVQELAATLGRPGVAADAVDDGSSYRVFEHPKESPNEGARTLVMTAADATASPFGWHDGDGSPGPEFTTTQGNNVHAYTDRDANNVPDPTSDPDGGASLAFDFPLDLGEHAYHSSEAAAVNLFYWNNLIHDVMYRYGFDEPAGNFQANNYGRGGAQGDYVRAEAQDGSGDNNANFSTPAVDGTGIPRMQMFLWPGNQFGLPNAVTVTSGPAAGTYLAHFARFTPAPTSAGFSGEIVLVGDGTGNPTDGCEPYSLAPGVIALVDDATSCNRYTQVANAEAAGAGAVIVANDTPGAPTVMTGSMSPPVGIPAVMVSQADGDAIKAGLPASGRVHRNTNRPPIRDGDLDAGIVIHEYGHGISNRLTGGPTVNCLGGQEQMGEGWSDYFAITMLLDPALDDPEQPRGMGAYALFQDNRQGAGIRPRPYSRSMAIQPATYDSIKSRGWLDGGSLTIPHGIGHVWAAVLWDVTWDLIEKHGFNPNLYEPWHTGGNNLALQLVIDGLKFQGCGPGFVSARDAIIAGDEALTGGENACTLWASFARRGLGFGAVQGSINRNDNTESFDTHPDCRRGFQQRADVPYGKLVREHAGRTVRLRFSTGGDTNLDVLKDEGGAFSRKVDCSTLQVLSQDEFVTPRELPLEAEQAKPLKVSGNGVYRFYWQTESDWKDTCREFVLTRDDGVQHRAYFGFSLSEDPPPPPEPEPAPDQLWVARYDPPSATVDVDSAQAIASSPDGNRIFVTGQSGGSQTRDNDFATVAYDAATGQELWVARYDGPADRAADQADDIAVSPDGTKVFVAGNSVGAGTGLDYATVAYDAATGRELWVARYNGTAGTNDNPWGLAVTGDAVVVTGESNSFPIEDYATVAYDADTGAQLWVARYDGPAARADKGLAVAASPDESKVLVTGYSFGVDTGSDYATIAYAADTGDELWLARHDGPGHSSDNGIAVTVSPNSDRVFVTGHSTGVGTDLDFATIAYDADTGGPVWEARFDGPGSDVDNPRAMAVSPAGDKVLVTGYSHGGGTFWDYSTIAYDAGTGARLWEARYDGGEDALDVAYDITVAGDDVFVTGESLGPPPEGEPFPLPGMADYATAAYDAETGEQRWVIRYNGPADRTDQAFGIAAVDDALRPKVYVTGQSQGIGTSVDYATIAYRDPGR